METLFPALASTLPLLFASVVGLAHAFEPDHLVTMSTIVSRRDSYFLAVKDGFYWGAGHTITLVLAGSFVLMMRLTLFSPGIVEGIIGVILVILGFSRLIRKANEVNTQAKHQLAFVMGLIHGLAGSGALVLLVMGQIGELYTGIIYMVVFGVGSVVGMCLSTALFAIPFTARSKINGKIRSVATALSALICVCYGACMIYQNFFWAS